MMSVSALADNILMGSPVYGYGTFFSSFSSLFFINHLLCFHNGRDWEYTLTVTHTHKQKAPTILFCCDGVGDIFTCSFILWNEIRKIIFTLIYIYFSSSYFSCYSCFLPRSGMVVLPLWHNLLKGSRAIFWLFSFFPFFLSTGNTSKFIRFFFFFISVFRFKGKNQPLRWNDVFAFFCPSKRTNIFAFCTVMSPAQINLLVIILGECVQYKGKTADGRPKQQTLCHWMSGGMLEEV